MGINAEFRLPSIAPTLREIDDFLYARFRPEKDTSVGVLDPSGRELTRGYLWDIRAEKNGSATIWLFERYYGPGYERGDFLYLASVGHCLEEKYGRVVYSGDHDEEGDLWVDVWPKLLKHFCGDRFNAYYK